MAVWLLSRCARESKDCSAGSWTEVAKMYEEKVVHRTAPFTEPQVQAVNP